MDLGTRISLLILGAGVIAVIVWRVLRRMEGARPNDPTAPKASDTWNSPGGTDYTSGAGGDHTDAN